MTVDHLGYIDPKEVHLSFMYFCPLAYGAKGLVVFTYWPPPDPGYRMAIVDRRGEKTPKYEIVQRLNLYVTKVIAPVIMNADYIWTGHASSFPGEQLFVTAVIDQSSPLVASMERRLLVGIFRRGKETFLLIVNKDVQALSGATIALRGRIPTVSLSPRVIGFTDRSSLAYVQHSTAPSGDGNSVLVMPELAGGEGRFVRIP